MVNYNKQQGKKQDQIVLAKTRLTKETEKKWQILKGE